MPPRRRFRRDPAPVGDLLARYQARRPPGAGVRAAATLDEAWALAAGELAQHSAVLRSSRNGVVTIACADAGTAQEISMRADELCAAMAAAIGRPTPGLRAVIADHAVPRRTAPAASPPSPPGPEAVAAAEGLAAHVTDPELRAAVQRAAAAALQRRWNR